MKLRDLILDLLKLQTLHGGDTEVMIGVTTKISQGGDISVKIEGFADELVSSKFVDGDGLILSMEWRK